MVLGDRLRPSDPPPKQAAGKQNQGFSPSPALEEGLG